MTDKKGNMTENEWIDVSGRVKVLFNFGIEKSNWLLSCRTARFIAAIPYLAGCDKARETSFSHLAIYCMSNDESGKDVFLHNESDDSDIFSRLRPISNFISGDRRIIDCCMSLLALNMICNYNKDADHDKLIGKYNPIAGGLWDFDSIYNELTRTIDANITPEISEYYSIALAKSGAWLY